MANGTTYADIVVACDGTWCGDVTSTTSNIKIIANSFAGADVSSTEPTVNGGTVVRFFDGIGLTGSLDDYIFQGALALEIRERCVEAYQCIVSHFGDGSRVWLFGLSRGAYTVRVVAGMINNCGILDPAKVLPDGPLSDKERRERLAKACTQVYEIYHSKDPQYDPSTSGPGAGTFLEKFREARSFQTRYPPVRFMGLLDTVGALGVPQLVPGGTFEYEFYDQLVSHEVQTVRQALSCHDRLAFFQPCFARRGDAATSRYDPKKFDFSVEEVWFPGSHYDIGRQRFIFARNVGSWERLMHWVLLYTNILGVNITYTPSLSNAPLLWLLTEVKAAAPTLLPQAPADYLRLWQRDALPWPQQVVPGLAPVSVDAYDAFYNRISVWVLRWLPTVGSFLAPLLSQQVLADRHMPIYPPNARLFRYKGVDDGEAKSRYVTVKDLGGRQQEFHSKTLEVYDTTVVTLPDGHGRARRTEWQSLPVDPPAEGA